MHVEGLLRVLVVAAWIGTCPIPAAPVHPLDIRALAGGADLIVVGQVTAVFVQEKVTLNLPGGSVPATQFLAQIRVDRVLKGGTESHLLSFGFSIPELPTGFQAATVGEYGVFFFKTQNNAVSFFDPVHPSLPAVPQSSVPPGEPLDRVVATIGEVLESNRASTSDQIRVLDALGRLQSERASEILRQALKRTSGELRLRIAITLVAGNDISGLELVHATLLEPGNTSEGLLRDAAGCISGLRDPQAIPVLVKLIDSRNAEVRRSAAIALRQTQSSAALEALSHLLDDEDLLTRYYAVVGLGEITHQDEWTPAFEEFQHNERYYLSHWRTWVEANLR